MLNSDEKQTQDLINISSCVQNIYNLNAGTFALACGEFKHKTLQCTSTSTDLMEKILIGGATH